MPAPVLPGAEPFSHEGGRGAVLVLHGFTGNPQSMRFLAEGLAAAGFAVELPLLPGHGTSIDDLVPKRWADWSAAAEDALEELASRHGNVVVAGLSMGGTLACWLAERHGEIAGIAVVNPLVDPPAESFRAILEGALAAGTVIAPGVGSDIAKPGVTELSYDGAPIEAALSLFEGVDAVAAGLERITCPVLLMTSREDHVVPSSSGDRLAAAVTGDVERVWLEHSYHVATLDNDAQEILERVAAFADGLNGQVSDRQGPGSRTARGMA